MPVIAGLLHVAIAAGRLSVLDFGGSLGSSYFQCRPFLTGVTNLRWSVVEQPAYVACGRKEFTSEVLSFYDTIEQCTEVEAPNVLFLSGVVQYLPAPYPFLVEALAHGFDWVICDRTPFLRSGSTRLTIQTVPPWIYAARYPAWFLSESRFVNLIQAEGYRCLAEFDGMDRVVIEGEVPYYKGFIWNKAISPDSIGS